ncbi:MAG: DNA repair protein RecO C-terminal domain-containing protein [Candidatus Omnitrophota bacterium]
MKKILRFFIFFLIKFLTLSGFKPELQNCVRCKKAINSEQGLFSISKGGLICRNCSAKNKDTRKISGQALQSLLYIQNTGLSLACRLSLSPRCEKELFSLLKEFYSYRFGFDAGLDI